MGALMDSLRIRPATADDVELIVRILIASKEESYPGTIDAHDRDVAFWENRWRGYLTEGSRAQGSLGDGFALLAHLGDEAVAFAGYHHTRRFGADAELQSIYVLKRVQGRGIGTRLLAEIAARLAADGSRTLCVGYAASSPYKRFYEKYGAEPLGPEYSIWRDVPALSRRLASVTER